MNSIIFGLALALYTAYVYAVEFVHPEPAYARSGRNYH